MSAAMLARTMQTTTLRRLATPRQHAMTPAAAFSTTRPALNTNPQLPAFSFKHITSNPRTKRMLIGGLVVLCSIEAYGWYYFAPQVLGKKKEGGDGENAGS
jgi:hypothetical protein